jgi:DNA modification methylase
MEINRIYCENCLDTMSRMPDNFIDCCVTSPPYYRLRDYGHIDQIGLEETPELYVQKLVAVFREVKRVLKKEGTLWLNLGDSYSGSGKGQGGSYELSKKQNSNKGSNYQQGCKNKIKFNDGCKPKDLIGIPWMVAFALRADGWYLRSDIIWYKRNPMPESVTDRPTKSHEYIFLLSRSIKYYYDYKSVMEVATGFDGRKDLTMKGSEKYANGYFPTDVNTQSIAVKGHVRWKDKNNEGKFLRNKRSVWDVPCFPYSGAHFATFPEALVIPCIKAGSPEGGIVYDPFNGAGTTNLVSHKLNRKFIGSEISREYIDIANKRIQPYLDQKRIDF